MKKYIAFYKPYNVVCQFTGEGATLAHFNLPPEVYAAGRLDKDSEGLLILSNDGPFIQRLTDPDFDKIKTYWVQVENIPTPEALGLMQKGLKIKDYKTKPCKARLIHPPSIPDREPPVRYRKTIPTCWLEVELTEGKNRQLRRMTAAIGHPTLRLIRIKIGKFRLDFNQLKPGQWVEVKKNQVLA